MKTMYTDFFEMVFAFQRDTKLRHLRNYSGSKVAAVHKQSVFMLNQPIVTG